MRFACPADFDPRSICLSVDVDWAHAEVIADLRAMLDVRGLRATFFVTHAGVEVPGHERGLHPNFRHNGDVVRAIIANAEEQRVALTEEALCDRIVGAFKAFAPEAKGVRAHSLHYDSLLLPIYRRYGMDYDSSYQIPLVADLAPFWKEYGLLEIPIYFNDHFELKTRATGLDVRKLRLGEAGLKVILLHPNLVFLNAASNAGYLASKPFHQDHATLLQARHRGRGIRTLLLELLDEIVAQKLPVLTLGEVSDLWRPLRPWR